MNFSGLVENVEAFAKYITQVPTQSGTVYLQLLHFIFMKMKWMKLLGLDTFKELRTADIVHWSKTVWTFDKMNVREF